MDQSHIPDIGSRHIAAVLAVAEYRSFVAAAASLRMSQPALTRSVKRVEDILGVQLFERSTRTVRVTEAGREFIAVARRITNDLRITVESMRELAEQKRGQVIVSSTISLANGVLPEAIAAYRKQRPGIEIQVRDGIHGSVIDDVKGGIADFGLNYLVDTPDTMETRHLGTGLFDLVVGRGHDLATSRRRTVAFDALEGVALVSLPPESQTRRVLDTTAAARGIRLRHAVVVSQIPTLLSFVRAGAGVGLVPSAAIEGVLGDGLVRLAVREPRIALDIGIVWLRDRTLSPAAEGLLTTIREHWTLSNA
jgi:DNA-binding transcriptional LysR family regulator